jgi:hypothetical protein
MCSAIVSPVAPSIQPAVTDIVSRVGSSQNRDEPQVRQKPRRAMSEEANHVNPRSWLNVTAQRLTFV